VSRALDEALRARLGARFAHGEASPSGERELTEVLALLRTAGGVGRVEPSSATVPVEAGARLRDVEARAREVGLSLGPLPPSAWTLDVASFLEGPFAGLRAIPGGRLEPIAIALTAILPDGRLYRSLPSPRSAAGPDLDAWFLGGGAAAGLLTGAVLRLVPPLAPAAPHAYAFADAAAWVDALAEVLAHGVFLSCVRSRALGARRTVTWELASPPETAPIDEATLHACCRRRGETAPLTVGGEVLPASAPEAEVDWATLRDGAGTDVDLHRLSLQSVWAKGPGIVPSRRPGAAAWMTLHPAADPGGLLGGGA
jgi:FAD/FMN-containing dehydrogenase